MRIAFDVKGTLDGPKDHIILSTPHHLLMQGHTCVIWSDRIKEVNKLITKHKLKQYGFSKAE